MTKLSRVTYSKWQPAANGYKSTGRTFGNSSFWMDDDFLDRDFNEGSKIDVIKLAGYKRAIGNFVRIVTGKDDIKVNYSTGKQSYTDGKTVVISSKLDEKEFDSTVGLALHEGSHIALTNFKTLDRLTLSKLSLELNDMLAKHKGSVSYEEFASRIKTLVNIIEDRRIDRYIYDNAPGYQGYYQSLYDKYFNAPEIDNALLKGTMTAEEWDSYEFHICNFANPNRQLNALKGLRSIWKEINLSNISRLKSTDEVFDLAVKVYGMINDEIGWEGVAPTPQTPNQNAQTESDADNIEADGENGDDDNFDMPSNNSTAAADPAKSAKETAKEEKAAKALQKAIDKQKQFIDGDIKKKQLTKKDAEQVEAAADSNMSYENVGGAVEGEGKKMNVECVVIKGFSQRLVDAGLVGGQWRDPQYVKSSIGKWYYATDYVQEGIALGTMLGKRLKTRDENRSLKTTRMETGRIDKRLIAELGFGNDRVFSQTIHNMVTPSLVHISLDASGSMAGKNWQSAVKTAVAIAKAGSMVASLDVVISLRGSIYQNGQKPLMWIIYDSRKDKFANCIDRFYGIDADGSTPEGLCYQAVMKDVIASANGKDAYLINLCDGEPCFGGGAGQYYGGSYAVKHTAAQVEKMRKAGIKVLGYFIGDNAATRSMETFKGMYGSDSEFIDTNSLPQLSKSLNKLFERK